MTCALLTIYALTGVLAPLNDGGLTLGGSPTLLTGHPTVSMVSEFVTLKITTGIVTTDCRFDFYNSGRACDVRMGFPDKGDGADDPYEETSPEDWAAARVHTVFKSFESWVGGRPVRCDLVKGKSVGEVYRTKTVHFPANSHVSVRDRYTIAWGGGVAPDGDGHSSSTGYILHTGSSWKGNIGSSTVIVEFDPKVMPVPGEMKFVKSRSDLAVRFASFKHPGQGVICYGPVKPAFNGRKLSFVRKDWRPTKDDDVFLEWGFQKFKTT